MYSILAPVIFITALGAIIGIQLFYRYRWRKGPAKAIEMMAEAAQSDDDIIASYICKMTSFSAAQLYIRTDHITCQNPARTFFDIDVADIDQTIVSSSGIRFTMNDGMRHDIGPLTDPKQFGAKLFFYHQGATSKAVLADVTDALVQVGLEPKPGAVFSRYLKAQMVFGVAALLMFAVAMYINLSRT